LLDLLGYQVHGGIKIVFVVRGVKVVSFDAQSNGALELFFRGTCVVVFQIDAGVDGPSVQMFQLVDAAQDMVLDRFG